MLDGQFKEEREEVQKHFRAKKKEIVEKMGQGHPDLSEIIEVVMDYAGYVLMCSILMDDTAPDVVVDLLMRRYVEAVDIHRRYLREIDEMEARSPGALHLNSPASLVRTTDPLKKLSDTMGRLVGLPEEDSGFLAALGSLLRGGHNQDDIKAMIIKKAVAGMSPEKLEAICQEKAESHKCRDCSVEGCPLRERVTAIRLERGLDDVTKVTPSEVEDLYAAAKEQGVVD